MLVFRHLQQFPKKIDLSIPARDLQSEDSVETLPWV